MNGLQQNALPVHVNVEEEPVFDLIPLRGTRREVTDMDRQSKHVSEPLDLGLPEPDLADVAPTAVGNDHELSGIREPFLSEYVSPAANGIHNELRQCWH